jgi:hypothetical protein
MKKAIIIIFILALITAGVIYFRYRKRLPKVSLDKIDWVNRSVEYSMSANGENNNGTQSIEDNTITITPTKDKKFTFYIEPIYGPGLMQFAILDDKNNVVTGRLVNFNAKNETALTSLNPDSDILKKYNDIRL